MPMLFTMRRIAWAGGEDDFAFGTMKDITALEDTCDCGIIGLMRRRSEEHTSELQSQSNLVCRLLLEKKEHTSEPQSQSNLVCRLLLEKKTMTLRGRFGSFQSLTVLETFWPCIPPTIIVRSSFYVDS